MQTSASGTLTVRSSAGSRVSLRPSGSKSMCGTQVISQKTSAPSFSFGSAPSRLTFTGAAARGNQTLQASVSSGGAASPGPIYNPAPTSKWLGDGPHAKFGTQEQRPSPGVGGEISRITGKSNLPGPGSYPMPPSVGKQSLGRCHSFSMYSFGTQRQRESAAKATPSPGPVYEPKGTKYGAPNQEKDRSYSFGNDARVAHGSSLRTPGPGTYNLKSSVGTQVDSQARSAQQLGFGPPAPDGARGILPLEGRQSPGPIYMNAPACKKQSLSTKRSAAHTAFTHANRFNDGSTGVVSTPGPGPGEYVV